MTPKGILIHRTEAGHTGAEVTAHESREGLGYHYFIDRAGKAECLQRESPSHTVWHARSWSHDCIGIAVYGDFDPADRARHSVPTEAQLRATRELCLALWYRHGILPIYGHTDLPEATRHVDKNCPGANFDVAALAKWVFVAYCRPLLIGALEK